MPAGRLGVKPGDKVVFWPTTLDCWKEYPSSWPAGGEMTFEEEVPSAPRPCKCKLDDGRTAWVFWCDLALPGTKGEWKMPVVKVSTVAGEDLGEFDLTEWCEDLIKKVVKPEPEVEYSLVLDGRRLVSTEPLKKQGVKEGSCLTLVKESKPLAGHYTLRRMTYPEDRYSEEEVLELLEDKTCTLTSVTSGTGRTGVESTTHKSVMRRGHWSAVGGKVVLAWDGHGSENWDIKKLRGL